MDLGTRHDTAEIFDGFKMFDFRWRRISKATRIMVFKGMVFKSKYWF